MARAVILGAGFAGVAAARELADAPLDVVVVDRNNFQTFQPLLYQVATAGLNAADVAYPVRTTFRRQANLVFLRSGVTGVDWDQRVVHRGDGSPIPFDYLIVAAGASVNYFGTDGADEHAFPLYQLADATRLRNHVMSRLEEAEAHPELLDGGLLTFVVVGGGPTGVEMAGALVELIKALRRDYKRIDITKARVVLVEMLDTVLPPFSKSARRYAHQALMRRGVQLRLGEKVQAVEPDAIRLTDATIPAHTVIWAAGVQANEIAGSLQLEQGRAGRIVVGPDLQVPGRLGVFVAGDIAYAEDPQGKPYPQLAAVAIQQGAHAGRQVKHLHASEGLEAFAYRDKGIMATIGRRAAVAELSWGLKLKGTLGWFAWLVLHLFYLSGVRNRLSVLLNWAHNYLAWDRGPRLILESRHEREHADSRRGD